MMDRFPVELKLEICFALPDIPSLVALTRASSSFYRIFTNSQSLIVSTVLSNEIHPAVLPHAIAVLEASSIQPWRKREVEGFLERYPESYSQQPRSIQTLSQASTIIKLHRHVQFFTEDFCTSILSVHPITKVPENTYIPPSAKELCRIQTAFYKFELFCTLFRSQRLTQKEEDRFNSSEQQELFLEKFKLWENEQLACVYDYLMRKVSLPFNDMVEHDVQWGELMINDDNEWPQAPRREGYLSQGLEFLHRLSMAKTYQEYAAVFSHDISSNYLFLAAAFDEQVLDHELESSGQSAMELQSLAVSELSMDDDSGPVEAWYCAHGTYVGYFNIDSWDLREWGYCLWDKARLTTWGLFRKPWKLDSGSGWMRRADETQQRHERLLTKSWKERSRIWQYGGTGWWDEGDESKIVWTRGTPAEQQKRAEDKKRAQGCRVHGPAGLSRRVDGVCPPGCLAREGERIRVGTSKGIDDST